MTPFPEDPDLHAQALDACVQSDGKIVAAGELFGANDTSQCGSGGTIHGGADTTLPSVDAAQNRRQKKVAKQLGGLLVHAPQAERRWARTGSTFDV